ncbi:MAG: hypothetical protein K9M57_00720 [Phycisphaerae bacterium]|nr:hypothetical protein [Phycisphaerae bacterium]
MEEKNKSKIWKIRTVKDYPEAHNHVLVGQVLEHNDAFIRLHCRSYHFGGAINSPRNVREGVLMVRIIPWQRVEVINELPSSFNYVNAKVALEKDEDVVLKDGMYTSSLASRHDKRY